MRNRIYLIHRSTRVRSSPQFSRKTQRSKCRNRFLLSQSFQCSQDARSRKELLCEIGNSKDGVEERREHYLGQKFARLLLHNFLHLSAVVLQNELQITINLRMEVRKHGNCIRNIILRCSVMNQMRRFCMIINMDH